MLTLFAMLVLSCGARAASLEHLGAPPPGTDLVELIASDSAASVLIAGTVNPPSVTVDGRPAVLTKSATDAPGWGVWVNGRPREVTGRSGHFSILLSSEESVASTLEVLLRDDHGHTYQGQIGLGQGFLSRPLRLVHEVEAGERREGAYFSR